MSFNLPSTSSSSFLLLLLSLLLHFRHCCALRFLLPSLLLLLLLLIKVCRDSLACRAIRQGRGPQPLLPIPNSPFPFLFSFPKLQFVLQFFIDESSIPSVAYKVGFLNLTSRVCQTVGYPVSNLDKLLEARTRLWIPNSEVFRFGQPLCLLL